MGEVRYTGWVPMHFLVCGVCSAVIPDNEEAKLNHERWHAQSDGAET